MQLISNIAGEGSIEDTDEGEGDDQASAYESDTSDPVPRQSAMAA
jgi:hypothetical protein